MQLSLFEIPHNDGEGCIYRCKYFVFNLNNDRFKTTITILENAILPLS